MLRGNYLEIARLKRQSLFTPDSSGDNDVALGQWSEAGINVSMTGSGTVFIYAVLACIEYKQMSAFS